MDSDIPEILDDSDDEKLNQDFYTNHLHPDDDMAVIFSIDKDGEVIICHRGRRWDKETAKKLASLLYSIHCGYLAVDNWAVAEVLRLDESKIEFVDTMLAEWLRLLQNNKNEIEDSQEENIPENKSTRDKEDRPIIEPWFTLKPRGTTK